MILHNNIQNYYNANIISFGSECTSFNDFYHLGFNDENTFMYFVISPYSHLFIIIVMLRILDVDKRFFFSFVESLDVGSIHPFRKSHCDMILLIGRYSFGV